MSIGKTIKGLREHFGMTQEELADGICSQTLVSRIERNDRAIPSTFILYKLSKRFGIDISKLCDMTYSDNPIYEQEVYDQIRKNVERKNFNEALQIISIEKKNPLFKEGEPKQFLLWQEGVSIYYAKRDVKLALNRLEEALSLRHDCYKTHSEQQLEVLTSIANIFTEEKNYHESLNRLENLVKITERHLFLRNQEIKIKILHDYTKVLIHLEQFEKGLSYIGSAIEAALTQKSMYLLGHLYVQKGITLTKLQRFEEARHSLSKALSAFDIEENDDKRQYVKKLLHKMPVLENMKGEPVCPVNS